jgi:hypothetical protein
MRPSHFNARIEGEEYSHHGGHGAHGEIKSTMKGMKNVKPERNIVRLPLMINSPSLHDLHALHGKFKDGNSPARCRCAAEPSLSYLS